MTTKYDTEIDNKAIDYNLKRLTNQIYKLLPTREEHLDWQKPLETITEELAGMSFLLIGYHKILFPLLCKLEGLSALTRDEDFYIFRRTIFECLGLIGELKNYVAENLE